MISEKHLFHGIQKRKGPLQVFWHIQLTKNSFEYSSLTGTRTSYTRLFVVTTRTRTEKFLWRNSNGWWLGGGHWVWDRWSRFLIETNSHLQQHVEETDREYDDEGRLEWRRVSQFLSICQSVFFQVCWLWRICEDDASIKSEKICWTGSNDSDLCTSILFFFPALNDLVKERAISFILFTVST